MAEITPKEGEDMGVCFESGRFEFYGEPGSTMTGTLVVSKIDGSIIHVLMDGSADQIRVEGDVIYMGTESAGLVTEYRRK